MSDSPLNIRFPQAVGLTASAFATGLSFSLSYFVVPRLMESPTTLMLHQFVNAYEKGKNLIAPIAFGSGFTYWYLAYRHYIGVESFTELLSNQHWKVQMYIVAGAAALGIMPYTLVFMFPVNKKIFAKEEKTRALAAGENLTEVGLPKEETAHALLDKWAMLNVIRASFLAVSAITGTWAALN